MVFIPGMGAITSTVLAGISISEKVFQSRSVLVTQIGHIRLGKRTENKSPLIKEFVSPASIDALEFAGWDIFEDDMYEAAKKADVVLPKHLEPVKEEMKAIKPMSAVFYHDWVKNLDGKTLKARITWILPISLWMT